MLGALVFIPILALIAWSTLSVVTGHYGYSLPMPHPMIGFIGHLAGPPILFALSCVAYSQVYLWRRMEEMRAEPTDTPAQRLARGECRALPPQRGPSGLERLCRRLGKLALIALPFWLGIPAPEWALGAGVFLFWLIGLLIR